MSSDLLAGEIQWQSVPLCCRYRLVRFETFTVQTVEGSLASSQTVHWAFGVLSDGQSEVLGAWLVPASGAAGWTGVFNDLQVRGVERIEAVVSSDPATVYLALKLAYPGAASLASGFDARPVGRTSPALSKRSNAAGNQCRALVTVSPRQKSVLAGEGVTQQLQSRVATSIARHGCFKDLEAAHSFVIEALRRAEQELAALRVDHGVSRGLLIAASTPRSARMRRPAKSL